MAVIVGLKHVVHIAEGFVKHGGGTERALGQLVQLHYDLLLWHLRWHLIGKLDVRRRALDDGEIAANLQRWGARE